MRRAVPCSKACCRVCSIGWVDDVSREVSQARAVGKVILLGEHAVVYGSPAIALALSVGARASAEPASQSSLSLGAVGPVLRISENEAEPAARAFAELLAVLGASNVAASAELELPPGAGLGASAALGVALARAVAGLVGADPLARTRIARAALAWEQVFHGNASGIDTAVAEHGGCLWFTRGEGPSPLIPGQPLSVIAAQVEPGQSTRRMVEGVALSRQRDAERVDRWMAEIGRLAREARLAIVDGDRVQLGQLMRQNHAILVELGVSTAGLNRAVASALEAGALGAKLTGAGGGGCALALVDAGARDAVLKAWQSYPCWSASTGVV
jgi:mevalonate kinase